MIRVFCAWCRRRELVESRWVRVSEEVTRPRASHGMCPDCDRAMRRLLEPNKEEVSAA